MAADVATSVKFDLQTSFTVWRSDDVLLYLSDGDIKIYFIHNHDRHRSMTE